MPLVVKDRVKETTTTTGTGAVTLAGPAAGFQSFSVIGNGNTTYYAIVGGTEWEVGIGTYSTTGPTLTRDTVLESSNSGSLVNFSAGTKDVFVTYPAEKSISDGYGTLPVANGGTGANTLTSGYLVKGNGTSAVSASVVYDNGTNVGIGTSSPGYRLTVSGSGDVAQFTNGTRSAYIALDSGGFNMFTGAGQTGNGIYASAASNYTALYTASSERMRIDGSGNVGIGTNIPGYRLSVIGSDTTNAFIAGATKGVRFAFNSTTSRIEGVDGTGAASYQPLDINGSIVTTSISGTERMRIDSSGNVGIGTTSPTSYVKLTVAGGLQVSGAIGSTTASAGGVISNENPITRCYVGDGTGYSWAFSKRSSSTTTDLVTILDSGNVGIGTSSPGSPLDVVTTVSGANGITVRGRSSDEVSNVSFKTNNAATTYAQIQGRSTELRLQTNSTLPITFYTNATEYFRIGPAGQIGLSGANYGTSGQVLTSNGSGSAPTWQSPSGGANIQEFSASGTWTKPSGAQFVMVECWGAGGGGGSGCRNTSGTGGGGGGGGAYAYRIFKASDLGATVSVTIGAGGTGAAAATGTANGTNGGDGGTTSFGTSVYGYGGGGGQGGTASRGLGGSGGGVLSAAATTTAGQPTSGQFGSTTAIDGASYPAGFGGGTGGACRSGNNAWNGGCSYQGGAGGGGGAVWGGWEGGVGGSRTGATGGGGSAGTWPGSGPNLPGGNGTTFGFGGGGGASGFSSTAGSSGGDGGIAAGGGGGGAGYSGVNGGAGGAGGAGYCRVYSW